MTRAEKLTKDCVQWIKDWFAENGPDCNAVVGISGGKDSTRLLPQHSVLKPLEEIELLEC